MENEEIARRLSAYDHQMAPIAAHYRGVDEYPMIDKVQAELIRLFLRTTEPVQVSPYRHHKHCTRTPNCGCLVDDFFPCRTKFEFASNNKVILQLEPFFVKGTYLFRMTEDDDEDVAIGAVYSRRQVDAVAWLELWDAGYRLKVNEISKIGDIYELRVDTASAEFIRKN